MTHFNHLILLNHFDLVFEHFNFILLCIITALVSGISLGLFSSIEFLPFFDVFFKNGIKLFHLTTVVHTMVNFSVQWRKWILDILVELWFESFDRDRLGHKTPHTPRNTFRRWSICACHHGRIVQSQSRLSAHTQLKGRTTLSSHYTFRVSHSIWLLLFLVDFSKIRPILLIQSSVEIWIILALFFLGPLSLILIAHYVSLNFEGVHLLRSDLPESFHIILLQGF